MFEFFVKGGPIMYPLLLCSVVTLSCGIERIYHYVEGCPGENPRPDRAGCGRGGALPGRGNAGAGGGRETTTGKGEIRMKKAVAAIGLAALAATTVNAQETTWSGSIRGVVEKHCIACHGPDSAPEYQQFKKEKEKWLARGLGMRMDTYSHLVSFVGWPNTGAIMRRLDDGNNSKDGKPGNMYRHLGANEEERQKNLALFKSWVANWSLKRWPETTKEELSGIEVRY